MNIAIDIDGVLTDLDEFLKVKGEEYLGKKIVNPQGPDLDTKFNVPKSVKEAFWKKEYKGYVELCKLRDGAKETIEKLHNEGNTINIITARYFKPIYGFKDEIDYENKSKGNLTNQGIIIDKYIHSKMPKVDDALKEEIDIFIEDSPYNVEVLKHVCKIIMFNTEYNKDYKSDGIYRVDSWNEVYDVVKKIQDEQK